MKIGIANDHKGYILKNKVKEFLFDKGYEVIDLGSKEETSDYPIFAFKLGEIVKSGEVDFGILICGTGIGVSIAANKVKGIRCAHVSNVEEAYLSRLHNDANVIALGSETSDLNIVDKFLNTSFSNEERHLKRIKMIEEYTN